MTVLVHLQTDRTICVSHFQLEPTVFTSPAMNGHRRPYTADSPLLYTLVAREGLEPRTQDYDSRGLRGARSSTLPHFPEEKRENHAAPLSSAEIRAKLRVQKCAHRQKSHGLRFMKAHDARNEIYRQQALDRLNSPDHLDTPIVVPRSAATTALLGLVVLVATLLVWAIVAR